MKCKNCGINDSDSILCESCWKMAIEISDRQNKEKLERSMTKTDLQKLRAVLDEIGVENWIQYKDTDSQRLWIETNLDLDYPSLQFSFDKDGRLIKS